MLNDKLKKKPVSKSTRSGLIFPVGRIHRILKQRVSHRNRVGASAAVYCAAVIEYLATEILDLAGNCCRDQSAKTITPKRLQLVIKTDSELDALIKATIPGAGVIPHIHASLLD